MLHDPAKSRGTITHLPSKWLLPHSVYRGVKERFPFNFLGNTWTSLRQPCTKWRWGFGIKMNRPHTLTLILTLGLTLIQGFSIIFSCGPHWAEDSSKIDVWGPNDHHCPMYFYVYWGWQRAKQVWFAGRIWPTGRHLRRPALIITLILILTNPNPN